LKSAILQVMRIQLLLQLSIRFFQLIKQQLTIFIVKEFVIIITLQVNLISYPQYY